MKQSVTTYQAQEDACQLGILPDNIVVVEHGIENIVFILECSRRKIIAKYYSKDLHLIQEEIDVLKHIRSSQVNFAPAIELSGKVIHSKYERNWVYFEYISGEHRRKLLKEDIEKIFTQISHLHRATSSFVSSNKIFPNYVVRKLQNANLHSGVDREIFSKISQNLHYRDQMFDSNRIGFVHGDLVPSNLIFFQNKPVIIDFDDSHNDFLAVDYISSIKHLLIEGDNANFYRFLRLSEKYLLEEVRGDMVRYVLAKFAAALIWGDHIKNRGQANLQHAIEHIRVVNHV